MVGLVANMYPHRSLAELGVANKYQAFYAGKIALWCYLIPEWDISDVTVAPGLTGTEREIGEAILNAAVKIYTEGTQWTQVADPQLTASPDREAAYPVTIDGEDYLQQVFTVESPTWVDGLTVNVSFQDGADVLRAPVLWTRTTRISHRSRSPAQAPDTTTPGSSRCSTRRTAWRARAAASSSPSPPTCTSMWCSTRSARRWTSTAICRATSATRIPRPACCATPSPTDTSEPEGEPDPEHTALKITKYEAGTTVTLSGATFEVVGPDGDTIGIYTTPESGSITIPLAEVGNYTIYERVPPEYHLLGEEPVKQVTVRYGEVAEVDFANEPYGDLRIEKIDGATGASLAGAKVQIKHIESGAVYTGTTDTGGSYTFTELKPGAYEIVELSAPEGWERDPQTYTTTVVAGECVTYT